MQISRGKNGDPEKKGGLQWKLLQKNCQIRKQKPITATRWAWKFWEKIIWDASERWATRCHAAHTGRSTGVAHQMITRSSCTGFHQDLCANGPHELNPVKHQHPKPSVSLYVLTSCRSCPHKGASQSESCAQEGTGSCAGSFKSLAASCKSPQKSQDD